MGFKELFARPACIRMGFKGYIFKTRSAHSLFLNRLYMVSNLLVLCERAGLCCRSDVCCMGCVQSVGHIHVLSCLIVLVWFGNRCANMLGAYMLGSTFHAGVVSQHDGIAVFACWVCSIIFDEVST